jgi:hypothetical protein
LAVWVPSTAWDEFGSVQVVIISSAVPVMPVADEQLSFSEVLPVATMTDLVYSQFFY